MSRWALALLAWLMLATTADASGNRLRLLYIAPPSPLPATQTDHFGGKTPVGFGGDPLGYANPQNLGFTRWLCITSQKDVSNADVTIFQIDQRNMLVPKNGAGAYGTAWSSPANGPYTVVVSESTATCASPLLTGNSTTVTAIIDANTAHVREMTSAARGCVSNVQVCAITNPDGGTGAFSSTTSQLNTLLTTGTPLATGDTIKGRTGHFNPTSLAYRVRPPLAGYSGSDWITITSETVDNTTDANGNPRLQNGFRIGAISVDTALSGDVFIPFDWTHLWFYVNVPGVVQSQFLRYQSAAGYGMRVSYSRFEAGPLVADHNASNGFSTRGATTVDHNHFVGIGKAITTPSGVANALTATFNVCESETNDFITMGGGNNVVTDNFCFNWAGKAGNHVDTVQHLGITSGASYAFGTVARNISVRNVDALPLDAQGSFNDDTTASFRLTGATVQNNIFNLTYGNQVLFTYFDGPNASFNTALKVVGSSNPSAVNATLVVAPGKGGTNATFARNIFNAYSLASQGGTVTTAFNTSLASTALIYQTAFPSYVAGTNPGLVNRAAAIAMFTPSSTGAAMNADGTVSGALLPANDFGEVCWNTGGVWDHTAHCTAAQ